MIRVNDIGQPLSSAFQTAMTTSHNIVSRFEIWAPGGTTPLYSSTPHATSAAIIDGSVTFAKQADQRGQCAVTIISPDGTLIPTSNSSVLTPWGNEIRIFSGVQYSNGSTEYVPMGAYRINQVQVTEQQGAVQMAVNGFDRSRNVSRNVVQVYWPDAITQTNLFGETPTLIGINATWPAMIQYVLAQFYANAQFSGSVSQWNTYVNDSANCIVPAGSPPNFSEGTDMFDQMRQFAQAGGCDLFANRFGAFDFYQDPIMTFFSKSYTPVPVITWAEGSQATFQQIQRSLTDAGAYNRVVVYGSGSILGQIAPLSSLIQYFGGQVSPGVFADDNDLSSPTYIGQVDTNPGNLTYGNVISPSPYGVVPNIVTNNLLVSQAQVNDFAQLTLRKGIGAQEQVTVNSALTDPRLEVDDVIMLKRARIGVDTYYLVDSLTIPLTQKSAMQLSIREKRNLST